MVYAKLLQSCEGFYPTSEKQLGEKQNYQDNG